MYIYYVGIGRTDFGILIIIKVNTLKKKKKGGRGGIKLRTADERAQQCSILKSHFNTDYMYII